MIGTPSCVPFASICDIVDIATNGDTFTFVANGSGERINKHRW